MPTPKIDLPVATSDKPTSRWVEVPDKDLFEFPFPTIRINLDAYPPGKHFVTNEVADWIENRIHAKQRADVAVMRRNPDTVAQGAMNRFGSGRGSFVEPEVLK